MWLASEMACFAQVVDLNSFTAAARALGVPKVAVSRCIRSLESRVGAKLLTRTTRRIALTDAGAALLPYCQRVAVEVQAARSAMQPLAAGRTGLRVLADPTYGRLLLSPLLLLGKKPLDGLRIYPNGLRRSNVLRLELHRGRLLLWLRRLLLLNRARDLFPVCSNLLLP